MRLLRDGALAFVIAMAAWVVQTNIGTDPKTASWRALALGIVVLLFVLYVDQVLKNRGSGGKPILRVDRTLTADRAVPNHLVYFRLRIWNRGGNAITPEVRVTRVLMGNGLKEAPFSAQLPLLLPWSNEASPPLLTRQHTAGETVGVLGAVSHRQVKGWSESYPHPLLYIAGAEHQAEVISTNEKIYLRIQTVIPSRPDVRGVEHWFWVQISVEELERSNVLHTSYGYLDRAPEKTSTAQPDS